LTYTYAYKSSDGVRHEAAMDAPSRDEVFAALRKQGIKPIKVVAADGSKANGEIRGVRKRIVFVLVAAVAIGAGVVAYVGGARSAASGVGKGGTCSTATARHQLYGDPVIIEEIEHGKTERHLPRLGDRLLGWFAQPGKLCCPKSVKSIEVQRLSDKAKAELKAVAESDVEILASDPREVQELKQMVNGMREEMRHYLANGYGTIQSFWRRLLERTRQEAQIYERTKLELEKETNPAVWNEKNEALRGLGLRTIPNPHEAE